MTSTLDMQPKYKIGDQVVITNPHRLVNNSSKYSGIIVNITFGFSNEYTVEFNGIIINVKELGDNIFGPNGKKIIQCTEDMLELAKYNISDAKNIDKKQAWDDRIKRYEDTIIRFCETDNIHELSKHIDKLKSSINELYEDKTLVSHACFNNSINVLQFLLKNNADPLIKTKYENTNLIMAVDYGHILIIKELLKYYIYDLELLNVALHHSIERNYIEITKLLIENNVNVNIKDDFYLTTPLCKAITREYVDIIKLLLDSKVNINDTQSSWPFTPLCYAIKTNNLEIVKLILKNNPTFYHKIENYKNPIDTAIEISNYDILAELIKYESRLKSIESKLNATALEWTPQNMLY